MAQKSRKPNFNQALEILRAHSFEVQPSSSDSGAMLVTKNGVGAVLAQGSGKDAPAMVQVSPGVMVRGQIARLLDRGFQKFIKTSQYELPATAGQLHAVHMFSEELKELAGVVSLYNESLGTVSDVYLYDRLSGREAADSAGQQQLSSGH